MKLVLGMAVPADTPESAVLGLMQGWGDEERLAHLVQMFPEWRREDLVACLTAAKGDIRAAITIARDTDVDEDPGRATVSGLSVDACLAATALALAAWDGKEVKCGHRVSQRMPLIALVHAGQVPRSQGLAVLSRLCLCGSEQSATRGQSLGALAGLALEDNAFAPPRGVPLKTRGKILRDLRRSGPLSAPELGLVPTEGSGAEAETGSLCRLLLAYSALDPGIGYVQVSGSAWAQESRHGRHRLHNCPVLHIRSPGLASLQKTWK